MVQARQMSEFGFLVSIPGTTSFVFVKGIGKPKKINSVFHNYRSGYEARFVEPIAGASEV